MGDRLIPFPERPSDVRPITLLKKFLLEGRILFVPEDLLGAASQEVPLEDFARLSDRDQEDVELRGRNVMRGLLDKGHVLRIGVPFPYGPSAPQGPFAAERVDSPDPISFQWKIDSRYSPLPITDNLTIGPRKESDRYPSPEELRLLKGYARQKLHWLGRYRKVMGVQESGRSYKPSLASAALQGRRSATHVYMKPEHRAWVPSLPLDPAEKLRGLLSLVFYGKTWDELVGEEVINVHLAPASMAALLIPTIFAHRFYSYWLGQVASAEMLYHLILQYRSGHVESADRLLAWQLLLVNGSPGNFVRQLIESDTEHVLVDASIDQFPRTPICYTTRAQGEDLMLVFGLQENDWAFKDLVRVAVQRRMRILLH